MADGIPLFCSGSLEDVCLMPRAKCRRKRAHSARILRTDDDVNTNVVEDIKILRQATTLTSIYCPPVPGRIWRFEGQKKVGFNMAT